MSQSFSNNNILSFFQKLLSGEETRELFHTLFQNGAIHVDPRDEG